MTGARLAGHISSKENAAARSTALSPCASAAAWGRRGCSRSPRARPVEPDREVIEVRSDEVVETDRLEPWLREHLPETNGPFSLAQFGGGHANLTYLIRFGDNEYVLRRPPLGPVAPGAHDMGREHRVLKDLWRAVSPRTSQLHLLRRPRRHRRRLPHLGTAPRIGDPH